MGTARLVIAGTHSGVGKTTVATGLMAALRAAGHRVAAAKVGPDFIDPSYHRAATGLPSRNLDAVLAGTELIPRLAARALRDADVLVVEGVMGLFDGAGRAPEAESAPPGGRCPYASTAHIARLLDAPVVLVVDAAAMADSIAAMVHGYATYDPDLRVAGVIANRVGSSAHAELLRAALGRIGLPLLGALSGHDDLAAPSRHLGLVPVAERRAEAERTVRALGERLAGAVDVAAVMAVARSAPPLEVEAWEPPFRFSGGSRVRIGVAEGAAFSFTYAENLELLEAAGADLVGFDPTRDVALPPDVAGLYIGGGFPETYADQLSANEPLRAQIAALARAGRPILAECGGLTYLCRSLDGQPMCGVLPAVARMGDGLTLGYRRARVATPGTWWPEGGVVYGQEFHRGVVEPAAGSQPAWRFEEPGRPDRSEGFVQGTVHASYLHTHWAATPEVARRFVAAARGAA